MQQLLVKVGLSPTENSMTITEDLLKRIRQGVKTGNLNSPRPSQFDLTQIAATRADPMLDQGLRGWCQGFCEGFVQEHIGKVSIFRFVVCRRTLNSLGFDIWSFRHVLSVFGHDRGIVCASLD